MTSRVLICNKSEISNKALRSALGCTSEDVLSFDNKYFSVDVELVFDTQIPVEEIADTVEAFVYIIDEPSSDVKSVFLDIDNFKDFLSEVDPAVKLLLINAEASDFESEFLEWCVRNEFEFIKYVTSEDPSAEEGLMGSAEGMGRVRAALECHMWPYRTMRNNKPPKPSEEFGEYVSNSNGAGSTLADFETLLESDDLAEGGFENLFSNMMRFKEVAGQLPGDERKRFAEEVAMSFYRAMGGSDEEPDT